MLVPPQLELHFREHADIPQPVAAVRGLTDLFGGLGECYLLSDGRQLHGHSRSIGQGWRSLLIPPPDDLTMKMAPPYLYLLGTADKLALAVRFAAGDAPAIRRFLDSFQAAPTPAPPTVPDPAPAEPTVMVGFAAALHAVAQADTMVDEAESRYIRALIRDEATVRAGFQLWQRLGTRNLIAWLHGRLNQQQAGCLMANLIELAMIDDSFRAIEKETVNWFRDGLQVDPVSCDAIFQVLMLKNRLSVFAGNPAR